MGESSVDKSGKRFAPLPNSSNIFVVVGRNMNQWRASMGFEEGMNKSACSFNSSLCVDAGPCMNWKIKSKSSTDLKDPQSFLA